MKSLTDSIKEIDHKIIQKLLMAGVIISFAIVLISIIVHLHSSWCCNPQGGFYFTLASAIIVLSIVWGGYWALAELISIYCVEHPKSSIGFSVLILFVTFSTFLFCIFQNFGEYEVGDCVLLVWLHWLAPLGMYIVIKIYRLKKYGIWAK